MIADNPAEDEVLIKAKINEASGLVAVLEEDKDNIFVVLSARALNPKLKIVAQAIEKTTVIKQQKAGADEVFRAAEPGRSAERAPASDAGRG